MANTALTALLPLEPLPTPPPPWWLDLLPVVLIAALILALLWWWRRPAQRRTRRLQKLQRQLSQANSDTRAIAAELEHLLRDATGHSAQRTTAPHPDAQALFTALQQARFQRAAPSADALLPLLPRARRLIRGGHA